MEGFSPAIGPGLRWVGVCAPMPVCHDGFVDDRALAAAIASGDRDAFRAFVERESGPIFRSCYRILGRRDEAEEVAQESFVAAYRAIGSYRGDGALGGWLARIAVRQAFRRLTQRKDVASLDPAAEGPADVTNEPLSAALAAERHAAVRVAVAELAEPYREVVVLRFFGDLPLNDIAAATERPLGTVKTHLRRGLERLRASLESERVA